MPEKELERVVAAANHDELKQALLQLPPGLQEVVSNALQRRLSYSETDSEIGAVYLVAGTGDRAPGSRKGPGYIRAKPAIPFLNRPLMHWHLDVIRNLGIDHMIIAGRKKENRQQTRRLIGYGDNHDMSIRYTPSRFDLEITGSADATRNALYHFIKEGPAYVRKYTLVIPCDQIFDLDLKLMREAHVGNNATITIATELAYATTIAKTYGLVLRNPNNESLVTGFLEKPALEEIATALHLPLEGLSGVQETMNAGIYLITTEPFLDWTSSTGFKELYERVRASKEAAKKEFMGVDFGTHFLPWALGQGMVIGAHPVLELGDLGNISRYIEALEVALAKGFNSINQVGIGDVYDAGKNVWIDRETLDWKYNGLTLRERIERGYVKLRNALIGRYVKIEGTERNPVEIENSCIGDEAEVHEGSRIRSSQISRGSYIGNFAVVEKSYVGVECGIDDSNPEKRTRVRNLTALADEVRVFPGVSLEHGQKIGPKLHITNQYKLDPHADIPDAGVLENFRIK